MAATLAVPSRPRSVAIEVCCDSVHSAETAMRSGAHRIELCSALSVGGVTPSAGLVQSVLAIRERLQAAAAVRTQVGVLIRPREGDFVYTDQEVDIIIQDVSSMCQAGVDFVVVGALCEDGTLHTAALQRMVAATKADASGAPGHAELVLHRCVDVAADYLACAVAAVQAGASRVLTSGAAATALQGADMLKELLQHPSIGAQRVCAASGITASNVPQLLAAVLDLAQVHGSFRGAAAAHTLGRKVLPGEEAGLRTCDEQQLHALLSSAELNAAS